MVDFSKTEITCGGEKITVTAKGFKTLEFAENLVAAGSGSRMV
jgi:hypothetical protein